MKRRVKTTQKLSSPTPSTLSEDSRFSVAGWKERFGAVGDIEDQGPERSPPDDEASVAASGEDLVEEEEEEEDQGGAPAQETVDSGAADEHGVAQSDGDVAELSKGSESVKNGSQEAADVDETRRKQKILKKFEKVQKNIDSRGVVYLSRIPPYMRVDKLRFLLSQYGKLDRLVLAYHMFRMFLTPEDPSAARRRKKSGGNKAQRFVDGWVEFINKKVLCPITWWQEAKNAALLLNNELIGGKKRNFYHDDVWNIQYLKGFKWTHLTEKIAMEKRTRELKIRNEMTEAKRTAKWYEKKVSQNKAIQAMEERKGQKRKAEGDEEQPRPQRTFKQRAAIQSELAEDES